MITLRCTQKLQRFLGIVATSKLELTTAALGDWYANLVPTVSGDLILFLNEKSLLSVAVPISESKSLIPLFRLRVANLLAMIGMSRKESVDELEHYDTIQYSNTASRRILGTMNDFAWQYQSLAEHAETKSELSLAKAELNLTQMPCKILGHKFPVDVAKELLNPKKTNAS